MQGPEHLEAGPARPGATARRGRWVLLAVVVAALALLLAVRVSARPGVDRPAPDPASTMAPVSSPASSTEPDGPGRAWPAGLQVGSGTLYVTSGRTVVAVDAATGLVTDTGLPAGGSDIRLTALREGLLVWHPDGRRNRLLRFGLDTGTPPGGALAGANRFLPASGGGLWAARVDGSRPADPAVWRRVAADGSATASLMVTGRAVADGAGGLLAAADGQVRSAYPTPRTASARAADPGAVVATGPDGFLVQRCTGGTCTTVLREGTARTRRVLDVPVAGSAVDGALSPANRFVLLSRLERDAPVVEVRPLASDRPLRTFPGPGSAAVWLSERWVVFLARDGLVLYDAVDDVVVPGGLPVGGAGRLAWQPS